MQTNSYIGANAKRIMVLSLRECIDFVVAAECKTPYIIISIQDTTNHGFGLKFVETDYCKGVHTTYFDDIDTPKENLNLITAEQAQTILDFVNEHDEINLIIIHCLHGQCRSAAVGAAIGHIYNGDDSVFFKTKIPNRYVYREVLSQYYKEKE